MPDAFRKGLLLLEDNNYRQALIEFQTALQQDPAPTLHELETLFQQRQQSRDIQITLTLGLAIFHIKKDEHLAIYLGNLSRKLKQYHQANGLYRQALRINRNNRLAYLSLAASLGKVDKYNWGIQRLLDQYFQFTDFVLPEITNMNALDTIRMQLLEQNANRAQKEIDIFATEKAAAVPDAKTGVFP